MLARKVLHSRMRRAHINYQHSTMNRIACSADELHDGEMRQVSVDGTEILLVRHEGEFRAYSAHCTHYGAPLVDGALSDGRLVCPWHHACFDAATGDLLEPPAMDALARYEVRVENGSIVVELPDQPPDRRELPQQADGKRSEAVIAIVGAGGAGMMAAQTLREHEDRRRIMMFTPEHRAPYDRPNLSKDYLEGNADPALMPLRSDDYLERIGIEIVKGNAVRRLSASERLIELEDGSTVSFEVALLAPGAVPRRLEIPGSDLQNIFTLRRFEDADAIIAAAGGARRAVVIGASFIAMEAAQSLTTRGMHVTVVAPEQVPFDKVLGRDIGGLFRHVHEEHGVSFRLGESVAGFEGSRSVEAVALGSGDRIAADLVVVGVGVAPATEFAEGLERDRSGGIIVDNSLRAAEGIYCAGDAAVFPDARTGRPVRIEHWRTALQQGRVAGRNIAGVPTVYDSVPFFWTVQFGMTLRYVGHAADWDEIVVRGALAERRFIAYYLYDGRVHAAAAMDRDRDLIAVAEAMRMHGLPTVDLLPS